MQVLTQYHAEVKSFPLSQARVGLMKPGRYSGFDLMSAGTNVVGIPIKIGPSSGSIRSVASDNTQNPLESTVLTGHGVVIKTPDSAQLSITINETIHDRHDTIYLEYLWEDSDTPSAPFIGVIEGSLYASDSNLWGIPDLTLAPALTLVTQTRLGVVFVPAGATVIGQLQYFPDLCPLLGDSSLLDYHDELDVRYAQLAHSNHFLGTQSTEPFQIDYDDTAETVIYTGDSTNALYITNNWKVFTLTGIEKTPGVPHHDGTRMTIFFYNVGVGSRFKRATNGHPPGFDYNTQGIFGGSYFPIKNGDMFEVILDLGGTWRIINAIDSLGGRILTIWNAMNLMSAKLYTPTTFLKIGEPASSDYYKFAAGFSSVGNANYVTSDRLKVGLNMAGFLELTGGFTLTTIPPSRYTPLITLWGAYNPSRNIRGFIYRDEDVGLSGNYKAFHLDKNGTLYVDWTGGSTGALVGTWWNINLIISLNSDSATASGGGLPSLY